MDTGKVGVYGSVEDVCDTNFLGVWVGVRGARTCLGANVLYSPITDSGTENRGRSAAQQTLRLRRLKRLTTDRNRKMMFRRRLRRRRRRRPGGLGRARRKRRRLARRCRDCFMRRRRRQRRSTGAPVAADVATCGSLITRTEPASFVGGRTVANCWDTAAFEA